ncbi:MAG TPA: PKD domain-containing protein [Kiritimatiellia bacterium]|nr:PKD domain-containing protein [Kiritimatiellia bacterium]
MKTLRVFSICGLAVWLAGSVVAAVESGGPVMLGGRNPVSLGRLPASEFSERLASLPAGAQARAIGWLNSFEFPEEDVHALHVDHEGGICYVCNFTPAVMDEGREEPMPMGALAAAVPVSPFPDSLKFNSRPGATNVIYLNFGGTNISGTAWNTSEGVSTFHTLPFSLDADYATFSGEEQLMIKRVWKRVAEDFASFDVNVTTEPPVVWTRNTALALITRNTDALGQNNPWPNAGGVAYVGVYGTSWNATYRPAWVYHNNVGDRADNIADVTSHEIGHNLGLAHDGQTGGIEYYGGHGGGSSEPLSWGPIMGTSYGRNISQWSKGEYHLANNFQDDMAIMASLMGYRPKVTGSTPGTATPLVVVDNTIRATTPETDPANANQVNKGVIRQSTDVDVWSFTAAAGAVNLVVRPFESTRVYTSWRHDTQGGNLHVRAALLDASGNELLVSAPGDVTFAQVQGTVPAGTYFLRVEGMGVGNPYHQDVSLRSGYTDYASVGQYFITGAVAQTVSYVKTYDQVYFRGTANGWGTLGMTLVSNYTWQTEAVFSGAASDRFKFDVNGDWALNFGDNNNDGIADQNGNDIAITQGAGTYRIWFHDQSRRYGVTKLVANLPPVANAGPDRTTFQMEEVLLDGSGSYDPDGQIASYRWSLVPGQFQGPIVMFNTNASIATLQWAAPTAASRTALVQLVVTDNDGASATSTVQVTQTSTVVYNKTYDQMYFRGTANSWGTSAMTLVSNYTWQIEAVFGAGGSERFKFDVNGDWLLNFGDNNNDGIADPSGNDIVIAQGAGTYRIWFHDQSRRYGVTKLVVNQPPVADAGPDRTVPLAGGTAALDGSGSYDPDGHIASFSWTQLAGPTVSINNPGTPFASVNLPPRSSAETFAFRLTVIDNEGASASDTMVVTQAGGGFQKTYDQVYFRGTPNGWGTLGMSLVSNYVWEAEVTVGGGSNERFKFDVHGDWSLNFGDNNNDGIADQSGNDIFFTQGSGTYVVRFHDQSRRYWVQRTGGGFQSSYSTMTMAGTFNSWNPAANNMQLVADYTWQVDLLFMAGASVQFKFTANGGWAQNWGINNQGSSVAPFQATVVAGAGNILLNNIQTGTHRITFNEQSRSLSVSRLSGVSAMGLPIRELTPWERYYGIDLLVNEQWQEDPDEDGLNNLEEMYHDTNPFASDTDGDGMSDLEEIVAGTNPLQGVDYFGVSLGRGPDGLTLVWPVAPGRVYAVQGLTVDGSEWTTLDVSAHEGDDRESHEASADGWVADGYMTFRVEVAYPGRED